MEIYRNCHFMKELVVGMILMASSGAFCIFGIASSEVEFPILEWSFITGFYLFVLIALWVCFVSCKKEKIRIDETGIECISPKGGQNWKLTWDEIEKLRFERTHRHPAVRIIPKIQYRFDPQSPNPWPEYHFEIDKKARAAILQYSPFSIEK